MARYMIEKNNQNEAILPYYEGKTFYLVENKFAHIHEIKVSPLIDAKGNELKIREAQIFC